VIVATVGAEGVVVFAQCRRKSGGDRFKNKQKAVTLSTNVVKYAVCR
jgi:hypothetical protein